MTPERYAVMGNPIGHSRSPFIHARFAAQTGHAVEYEALLAEPDGFADAVAAFRAAGGRGLNVTVPFKEEAYRLATRLSERARLAGAVNTLWFEEGGTIAADNTDGIGLVTDLTINLGRSIAGARVLMLGAGGAARGALGPLLEAGPEAIVVANRTHARAVALAADFAGHGPITARAMDDLPERGFDLLINATAASLSGERLAISAAILAPGAWCYDMVYAARPTAFVEWARGAGAQRAVDGVGMLVEQAAESFRIWRGVRPETGPVITALRESLAQG